MHTREALSSPARSLAFPSKCAHIPARHCFSKYTAIHLDVEAGHLEGSLKTYLFLHFVI